MKRHTKKGEMATSGAFLYDESYKVVQMTKKTWNLYDESYKFTRLGCDETVCNVWWRLLAHTCT